MPFIKYEDHKLNDGTLHVIGQANQIIDEYADQGFSLTVRQLYYQFVARDIFPDNRRWSWTGQRWVRDADGTKNADPNYKWLAGIVSKGRMAGLIDWNAIEDRTRWLRSESHWSSPHEMVEACAQQYRVDLWERQKYRPEVWIEKDALIGVIEPVCVELDVPFFACRGYVSQSEQWNAAQRLRRHSHQSQHPIVFHLGDHDPSGVDMTRDNLERLDLFSNRPLEVRRLALNWDQIEEFDPPPSPAKLTDSRARGYIAEFGDDSWELDALEPQVMADLIRTSVEALINRDFWDEDLERQADGRRRLRHAAGELHADDEEEPGDG